MGLHRGQLNTREAVVLLRSFSFLDSLGTGNEPMLLIADWRDLSDGLGQVGYIN